MIHYLPTIHSSQGGYENLAELAKATRKLQAGRLELDCSRVGFFDANMAAPLGAGLARFETGTNDFNNGLLAETCRHNGWKLVTNYGDFTAGEIEVLTTNPELPGACS